MLNPMAMISCEPHDPNLQMGFLPSWNAWSRWFARTELKNEFAAIQTIRGATPDTNFEPTRVVAMQFPVSAIPKLAGASTASKSVPLARSCRCAAVWSPRSTSCTASE